MRLIKRIPNASDSLFINFKNLIHLPESTEAFLAVRKRSILKLSLLIHLISLCSEMNMMNVACRNPGSMFTIPEQIVYVRFNIMVIECVLISYKNFK